MKNIILASLFIFNFIGCNSNNNKQNDTEVIIAKNVDVNEFEKLILSIKDSFKEKMVFEETENNELEYSVYLIHKLETDLNPSTSRKITEFKSKMI